tara:strand:+ start:300 stop:923 length:624 start_codon:yes stop_codon:yes gene_type:complete
MFSTTNNTTSLLFSPQPQQNLFSFNNSNSKKFTNSENSENSQNSENSSFMTNKSNLFSTDLFNQNSLKNPDNKKIDIVETPIQNNEISKLNNEISLLRNVIDELKSELKSEIKKEISELKNVLIENNNNNNNNNNGIYVKCNLHEHMLKEQTVDNLKGVYLNGFVCDNCGYKQQNIIEKFYNCNECKSNLEGGGGFDLCITCVKISL